MKRLLGGILQAIGILIAGASGLCSAYFLLGMLRNWNEYTLPMSVLSFVVGGIPFAIGVGLFFVGRSLFRSADEDRDR